MKRHFIGYIAYSRDLQQLKVQSTHLVSTYHFFKDNVSSYISISRLKVNRQWMFQWMFVRSHLQDLHVHFAKILQEHGKGNIEKINLICPALGTIENCLCTCVQMLRSVSMSMENYMVGLFFVNFSSYHNICLWSGSHIDQHLI